MGIREALRVRWNVEPLEPPRIWRHCGHCGRKRPFSSSGKFRSNTQKKRLDVWLIYRCAVCGRTWNYPLFERRPVGEIAPPLFEAIARNCAGTARCFASDATRLRAYVDRLEPCSEIKVEKAILEGTAAAPAHLAILLALAAPCDLRLERLLAKELGLSRSIVRKLAESRSLRVAPDSKSVLREAPRDGQMVTLDLAALPGSVPAAPLLVRAARCG